MGQADEPDRTTLFDPFNLTDLFATGVHHLELAGPGVVRLVYFTSHVVDGKTEHVSVQRIVMPMDGLLDARLKVGLFMQDNAPGKRPECMGCRSHMN